MESEKHIEHKRIVSPGYLLYEYLDDDRIYKLVGVIDIALGGHGIDIETGITSDKLEAEEFYKTGKIKMEARFVEKEMSANT